MREKGFRGNATVDEQAETLKETVYVTFTILAVLIANAMHDSAHSSSGDLRALAGVVTVTAAALAAVGWVAVRRSGSSRGRRLIILVALVVLSLCVVGLQLIAHS